MSSGHIIKSSDIIDSEIQKLIDNFLSKSTPPTIIEISDFLIKDLLIDITTDQDIVSGYDHDWSNLKGSAIALCRPKDRLECAIIMRICFKLNINMTISAGRTNLTGSATPNGGIIISIINLNSIGNINYINNTIESSPGVYLEDLRNHIIRKSKNKLEFPVDPTSRKEAMVGGTISCNASGFIPGEKGAMRYWIDSIDLLLPSGEIIKINRGNHISHNGEFIIKKPDKSELAIKVPTYNRVNLKNASGPFSSSNGSMDFIDLIIGSEGIFGCITNATLKLKNKPTDYLNLFIKLKNEDQAFEFYSYISDYLYGDMSKLSGFEYFGENCLSYMNHHEYLFDEEYNVGVYMQIPIYNEKIDNMIEDWYEVLMRFKYIKQDNQILSLNEPRNWKTFFEARHSIPANALHQSRESKTASIITDTIVPPPVFNQFIKETHKLIKRHKIDYLLFGHLGDCHLHFHLIPNQQNEDEAISCYHKIIQISSKLGGVYSAEHGTGKRKRQDFIDCYGDNAVKQIIMCKEGFDPNFLLNNGNVVRK